jgi:hypothetical protein
MYTIMRSIILLCLTLSFFCCSQKNQYGTKKASVINKYQQKYSITTFPIVTTKDTTSINEIRFFTIKSCADTHKMMYENYGLWTNKLDSEYLTHSFPRLVWSDLDLFGDGQLFSVITDGKESKDAYFASLIIVDSDNKDCLHKNYPNREKIIQLLSKKLFENNFSINQSFYQILRTQS